MIEILSFEFIQNALLAGILASIACGIIGSLVVANRIVFISGSLAHAAYGGVGIALFLGISPFLGALGFCLLIALLLAVITERQKQRSDTVIGVIWAVGMAIGIILVDLTPGYNVDLMSYLFGSILAVPRDDLWLMLAGDAVIVSVVFLLYRQLLAMSYDSEFAFTVGVPVKWLYALLFLLIAVAVVMVIRVVGMILVIALFTVPPYIAERHTRSLAGMIVLSVILSIIFTVAGLWLSYLFNLTSGATIILVAATAFLLEHLRASLQAR